MRCLCEYLLLRLRLDGYSPHQPNIPRARAFFPMEMPLLHCLLCCVWIEMKFSRTWWDTLSTEGKWFSLFTTVPLNSWEGKATRDLVSPELNLHFKKKPRRRRRSRGLKRVVKLREKCNLIQNSSKRVRWSWRLATAKSHSPSKLRKLAFSHEAE